MNIYSLIIEKILFKNSGDTRGRPNISNMPEFKGFLL